MYYDHGTKQYQRVTVCCLWHCYIYSCMVSSIALYCGDNLMQSTLAWLRVFFRFGYYGVVGRERD